LVIGIQELIWRKGDERCERSYIQAQQPQPQRQTEQQPQTEQQAQPAGGFRQVSNKREEASAKINERYLVGQPNQNPFMPNNNYAQDIEDQMNFMTPQKSG
jgi:hypothetical protein